MTLRGFLIVYFREKWSSFLDHFRYGTNTVLYPMLLDEMYKSFLHFKSDNNIAEIRVIFRLQILPQRLSFIMDYRLRQ